MTKAPQHRYELVEKTPGLRYTYGPWEIAREDKPIPTRAYDWDWWHKDYDGEGDARSSHAESLEQCIEQIHEYEDGDDD